jgi:hypothetical protein
MTFGLWFWHEYQPWTIIASTLGGCGIALLLVFAVFLPPRGSNTSRYWRWRYGNIIRRVSWRYPEAQVSYSKELGARVELFRIQFRSNRCRLAPRQMYLETETGRTFDFVIQSGNGADYRPANEILIPKNVWLLGEARSLPSRLGDRDFMALIGRRASVVLECDDGTHKTSMRRLALALQIERHIDQLCTTPTNFAQPKGTQ